MTMKKTGCDLPCPIEAYIIFLDSRPSKTLGARYDAVQNPDQAEVGGGHCSRHLLPLMAPLLVLLPLLLVLLVVVKVGVLLLLMLLMLLPMVAALGMLVVLTGGTPKNGEVKEVGK